jgi:hypothetical protein
MHKSGVVVGTDDVSKSRQTLLNSLDLDLVGQGVSQVLQLNIRSGGGHKQTSSVAGCETAHESGAANGGVDNRNGILELGLERAVEVLGAANSHQTVGVGELGKDTNLVRVFKLGTRSHYVD